ncbi:MAG: IS200/IS605 family transposase [Candidatus Margulisiibacteriota bacterium]
MYKIIHYVFSTYKRKKVLIDWIAEELAEILKEICKDKGFELISQNILSEHVHMLLKKKATDRNEYIMKIIKGISSRYFFRKHPGNRFEFRKLWGRGYRAKEIKGDEHLERIICYIEGQKINGVDKRIK